ncbi:MAG TPA: hypothetical protein VEF04_16340 [Blastocatellia bacterium]|nr:hypothetical protein [Blastocatellia bacterium]
MARFFGLFFALIVLPVISAAQSHQTSIIPITETINSNGAFVRGVSNDGKRTVFESTNDFTGENKDGNNEIFVYDADLQKIIQITKTGNQTSGSSSGSSLSATNCPGGCTGTTIRISNTVPAISGDGTKIVFASNSGLLTDTQNPDGNYEIYLATLPRGAVNATFQRITETDGIKESVDNNTPTINYDGSVIAFISTRRLFKQRGAVSFAAQNEDGNAQLYVFDVNARRFTQATYKRISEGMKDFESKGFIANPSISGNGKTLAFISGFNFSGQAAVNNADLNAEVFLYNVGDPTNQVTQVTNTSDQAKVPEDGAVNVFTRFSKHLSDDGSLLVFESAGGISPVKTGARIRDVFLYRVKTGEFTQVTTQNVGQQDLSDYNYFPSINGSGTFVTFSSKLNLPTINDPLAGNFDNSREIYRYDVANSTATNPQFFLATQTALSTTTPDQRQILFAPFINDSGQIISFSNNGNLIAPNFNTTPEVFQALLRPVTRESLHALTIANHASLEQSVIARGSIVLASGAELATTTAESNATDNFPFEINGVSVTVGEGLSGIAGRVIAISPTQVRFVFPTGLPAADEMPIMINNNGIVSKATVELRDAAPGIYTVQSNGQGQANGKCSRHSDDGQETEYTDLPCAIGNPSEQNSIVLYGTGWRFGSGIQVRFRFTNDDNEDDEITLTPSYAGKYKGENDEEYLGLDQINVTLDEDLAGKVNVETVVLLTSNSESVTSQEQVTTSFGGYEDDMNVVNAASSESASIARGSIASAFKQDPDDETAIFTNDTITAPATNPPFELGGIRVKVAGLSARILYISPNQVNFIVPEGIEPASGVLARITNGTRAFNARINIADAAPGLFTQSGDGKGTIAGKCGFLKSDGTVEYTAPPCAVSNGAEKRTLVLIGTGWRFATGVKVTFDNVTLTPTYTGPEPGMPGVDRIEVPLPADLAARENDIIVNAAINGTTVKSQTGAKISFQALPDTEQNTSRSLNGQRASQKDNLKYRGRK